MTQSLLNSYTQLLFGHIHCVNDFAEYNNKYLTLGKTVFPFSLAKVAHNTTFL